MTLAEVLKNSGWSQAQIDALDAQAMKGLGDYVSGIEQTAAQKEKAASDLAVKAEADRKAQEAALVEANTAKAAAEAAERGWADFRDNTYNPGIAAWEAERVKLAKAAADAAAESAFYKAQHASLKDLGFVPADSPVFTPSAAIIPAADPNKTPGTPTFTINDVRDQLGASLGTVANIQWKYRQLYNGQEMPISPTELLRQSEANKFKDPATYASQLFKFADKEEEQRQAAAKAHDDAVAAAAVAEKDEAHKLELKKIQDEFAARERLRAEQYTGSNGDVKLPPGSAKFSDLRRAQQAGERKDPTKMTPQERRQTSLDNIHKALEERQAVVA